MFTKIVRVFAVAILLLTPDIYIRSVGEPLLVDRIDFVDSDPIDIATILAQRGGYNIVISSDNAAPPKKMTVHMEKVDLVEAIGHVLSAGGLKFRKQGRTILISRAAGPFIDEGSPTRQVMIESRVVEVSESGMEELGIKWGRDAGSFRFAINKDTGKTGLTEDIIATVKALAGEGKAEILAEPSMTTLDRREAKINIGSRIPYAVPANTSSSATTWAIQYIDAGVSLKIDPAIEDEGFISVMLRPEVSSISEWRVTSAGEFPVITTRNAETRVRVKDGETIVIGGLTSRTERSNLSKVPYIGDIPVVGNLFRNHTKEMAKTEVIFLITPHII